MTKIAIEISQPATIRDLQPGCVFTVSSEHGSDKNIYLKTTENTDDKTVCVELQTGIIKDFASDRICTKAVNIRTNLKRQMNIYDINDVPAGSIMAFESFPGEEFIKTAGSDEMICCSLSTGKPLTKNDSDIINLPVIIYDADLLVRI